MSISVISIFMTSGAFAATSGMASAKGHNLFAAGLLTASIVALVIASTMINIS